MHLILSFINDMTNNMFAVCADCDPLWIIYYLAGIN